MSNADNQQSMITNPSALEPLFAPWEEPSAHRLRGDRPGDPAKVVKTRRPSPIAIVNNLRMAVREWREAYYIGASDTTRQLLAHWFERPHRATTPSGEEYEFRCRRSESDGLRATQR